MDLFSFNAVKFEEQWIERRFRAVVPFDVDDELNLWSVFMTGSKTPGMSDTEMYLDSAVSEDGF